MKRFVVFLVLVALAVPGLADSTWIDGFSFGGVEMIEDTMKAAVSVVAAESQIVKGYSFTEDPYKTAKMEVYNLRGQLVKSLDVPTGGVLWPLQLDGYARGIYFYRFVDRNGAVLREGSTLVK